MGRLGLFVLVARAAEAGGRFDRSNARCQAGRSSRGLGCEDYAFFEFAPASGAGMTQACACTAVTGAKGEAVTVARTGAATCARQANATTGILDGDLVVCSNNNEPRVELVSGAPSLRAEAAATNVLARFINICDAAWANVATPALTGQAVAGTACATTTAQTSPWTGTYANAAVKMDDNDAVAFEGRTQTVTVTAAAVYTMSCYLKAGTQTAARLSLDGTTADFPSLSTTTWTLASVTDASSSGVAIAAQVLVGDAVGDTGTVIVGGCQVEARAQVTRMIPTEAAAATRNAEVPYVALPEAMTMAANSFCMAATIDVTGSPTTGVVYNALEPSQNIASGDVNLFYIYNGSRRVDLVGSAVRQNQVVGTTPPFDSGPTRYVSRFDGSTLDLYQNATSIDSDTGAAITIDPFAYVYLGVDNASSGQLNGNIYGVQLDTSPTRCSL